MCVDDDTVHLSANPRSQLLIPPWNGNVNDCELQGAIDIITKVAKEPTVQDFAKEPTVQDSLDICLAHTPLHLASKKGRYTFILLLLAYGADPEATDNLGQTALVIFRKRHALGPILCLPTIASHDAHNALALPRLSMPTSALPPTAFYA